MTLRSILAWPLLRLKMFRVGRGFTVHSPFAYRFILGVLRERLPYYAFTREVTSRPGRRLFRVAAFLNPLTVCYLGDAPCEARRIISIACPRAREINDPAEADLTWLAPGAPLPPRFRALYAEKCAGLPSEAMTFTNGCTLIAIRRHGLPHQSFRLKF